MITLFQFSPAFNLPNPSPYCLKLETFLRLADLEYQVRQLADPRKAPKGKLPFITLDGKAIADSAIIIETLRQYYQVDLDAGLDARGRAWALSITRMCDEHLIPLLGYFRWLEEPGFSQAKTVLFRKLAAPLRPLVAQIMRRKVRKAMQARGFLAHSREQLLNFAREDLQALDGMLGDLPYFGGVQPCSADAATYGTLANLILGSWETPLNDMARSYPQLVAYCERMQARVWSE